MTVWRNCVAHYLTAVFNASDHGENTFSRHGGLRWFHIAPTDVPGWEFDRPLLAVLGTVHSLGFHLC